MLKDHNAVTPVGLEPATPRSRLKHSTTEPLCLEIVLVSFDSNLTDYFYKTSVSVFTMTFKTDHRHII